MARIRRGRTRGRRKGQKKKGLGSAAKTGKKEPGKGLSVLSGRMDAKPDSSEKREDSLDRLRRWARPGERDKDTRMRKSRRKREKGLPSSQKRVESRTTDRPYQLFLRKDKGAGNRKKGGNLKKAGGGGTGRD